MANLRRIAIAILTLDAVLVASTAQASPQSPRDAAPSTPKVVPDRPSGGRVVTDVERCNWYEAAQVSGVLRYLTEPVWDGRGYVARAISLTALLDFLDRQLIVEYDGIFRRGPMHRKHRDVGPRRRDYRTDRGTFGDGSLQVVVSRVTGVVFFDMDKFSPYQDIRSFVGHSWEVARNRFRLFADRTPNPGRRTTQGGSGPRTPNSGLPRCSS